MRNRKASAAMSPPAEGFVPPDLSLQAKFDAAIAASDNSHPLDPSLADAPPRTLATDFPTLNAKIQTVNNHSLRTNTISLVNLLVKRQNDYHSLFYRFVKGYLYHGETSSDEEKLFYRYPNGATGIWGTPQYAYLANETCIQENPMGIRIATLP